MKIQIKERDLGIEQMDSDKFLSLNGNDVIRAQISDHHPVVHQNVLFWNVMMKANCNNQGRFNNGFKIIESNQQYQDRLEKIGYVISEIIFRNPEIFALSLCEGPIEEKDIAKLFSTLKKFPWMHRFTDRNGFYSDNNPRYLNWGLLSLMDNSLKVNNLQVKYLPEKLMNRFFIWELEKNSQKKYFALAHFPYSGDEKIDSMSKLSKFGKLYSYFTAALLQSYADRSLIFCADFNINPYIVGKYQDRELDKVPFRNSLISSVNSETVTVDGILLSNFEKQRNFVSNISRMPFLKLIKEQKASEESNSQNFSL